MESVRAGDLYLWFFLYSAVGWAYESLLFTVYCRRPVNRGFLKGPFVPLYGCGGVLLVALLYGRVTNPAHIFLIALVLTTALEYVTAVAMENLFRAKWWDYSMFPLNFQGRISLISSVVFAAMALLTLRFVHPQVERLTGMIPPRAKAHFLILATVYLLGDITFTVRRVLVVNGRLGEMRGHVSAILAERRGAVESGAPRRNASFAELLRAHFCQEWPQGGDILDDGKAAAADGARTEAEEEKTGASR